MKPVSQPFSQVLYRTSLQASRRIVQQHIHARSTSKALISLGSGSAFPEQPSISQCSINFDAKYFTGELSDPK
jgi:hypothetical protein